MKICDFMPELISGWRVGFCGIFAVSFGYYYEEGEL